MTVEKFLVLLTILSVVTSLITEAVKKFINKKDTEYATNIVVLIVSVIVGGTGTVVFYMYNGIAWDALNVASVFLMIVANWLVAMLGYDKVMQAITQIKSK